MSYVMAFGQCVSGSGCVLPVALTKIYHLSVEPLVSLSATTIFQISLAIRLAGPVPFRRGDILRYYLNNK